MAQRSFAISCSMLAQAIALLAISSPAAAQGAQPRAGSSDTLDDIVVTAQKRDQNLQKIPLAVTVVTGDQLSKAGINDISALGAAVPNVSMFSGSNTQITIRGIGINASPISTDQAVAVNIDGVYMSRSNAINGGFFDIDRVEALRGPQGTLYGRNTTAGAINITTAKPVFDYAGSAEVEFGNLDSLRLSGMLNVPLNDKIAVRAAFQTNRLDGYMSSNAGKVGKPQSTSGRLHVLVRPTENLKILLSGDYIKLSGDAGVFKPASGVSSCTFCTSYDQSGVFRDGRQSNLRTQADWDLGGVAITYIGARVNYRDRSFVAGAQPNQERLNFRTWTHELRFSNSSNDDRLQWLVGAYSLNESGEYHSLLQSPRGNVVFNYPIREVRSQALFGQTTYALTDWARATAGLRYSHDKKVQDVITAGGQEYLSKDTWRSTSWRLALEADATANSLLYASVSTGFRAGGFYDGAPPNTFQPEKITAYSLGSKNSFAGGAIRLNVEAFYYVYKDLQVSSLEYVNPFPATGSHIYNVGRSEVYGIEFDGSWRLGPNDRIDAYGSYLHAEYTDFVIPFRAFPPPNGTPPTVYSGETMSRSPRLSGRATYSHVIPLAGGNTLTGSVTGYATKGYWLHYNHIPQARQNGYAKLDANLAFKFADRDLTLTGYVRNITNQAVAGGYFLNGPQIQLEFPRTYGAMISAKF